MLRFALKNLSHDRGRSLISIAGVAASLVLVLILDGVFAGTSEQIVAYPRRAGADVWVMQSGTSNMHMATSTLPATRGLELQNVAGVAEVVPILYINNFVEAGGREWFSYVVGIRETAPYGGPWSMAKGAARPQRGQIVVPATLARKANISLGDRVSVMGRTLAVAGTSNGTFSMANSVTFVHYDDLRELMFADGQASYFLLTTSGQASAEDVAARINADVEGTFAMTRASFVASDRKMALQMGSDIIRIMAVVGFMVSILIIGFMTYTATLRRRREFAVAKALGARNRQLYAATFLQTLLVTGLALALALVLAVLLRPVIQTLVPEVALLFPLSSILRLTGTALAAGILAAWIPARHIGRIDPALAFRD